MPNRMLRDWTRSEKVDKLTCEAERFFTRLIMKVDDYGCFYAEPALLRCELFPWKINNVTDADVMRWANECVAAGIIVIYQSGGKRYLMINDFRQRLDKAKSKYPKPVNVENQPVNDFRESVNDFPAEVEVEVEKEVEVETEASNTPADLKNSNLFRQPVIPTKDEVHMVFKQSGGTDEMATAFYDKNSATGWFLRGSPITNFRNLVPSFINNWKQNETYKRTTPRSNRNAGTQQLIDELRAEAGESFGA